VLGEDSLDRLGDPGHALVVSARRHARLREQVSSTLSASALSIEHRLQRAGRTGKAPYEVHFEEWLHGAASVRGDPAQIAGDPALFQALKSVPVAVAHSPSHASNWVATIRSS
jgi:hypothetical protein